MLSMNTATATKMNRTDARKVARLLAKADYAGIQIVEYFPEGWMVVRASNRCGMPRTYGSLAEALEDVR